MNTYQQYIHISRYSRWLDDLGRRETWEETIQRLCDFWLKKNAEKFKIPELDHIIQEEIKPSIMNHETMPSMRTMMSAGLALERENVAGYNCAYRALDEIKAFSESLYILMCGTGVGFSCEREFVNQIPALPETFIFTQPRNIVVEDSKEGWAQAFQELLDSLWDGYVPAIDYSRVRPAGARLKVFGGRASGPEPLKNLFEFTIKTVMNAAGRCLHPIEAHDIMCMIGDIVVVGGVRRAALISLSDLDDQYMANAKGVFRVYRYVMTEETDTHWHYSITMHRKQPTQPTYTIALSKEKEMWDRQQLENDKKIGWWVVEPQRRLANNSSSYKTKPMAGDFLAEWTALIQSNSGERGIFNEEAAKNQAAKWGRRVHGAHYGCNPCSEILLLSQEFCNLTETVVRSTDTVADLKRKIRIATILGTLQATLTDFQFLGDKWSENCKEEALLGTSLTGIMDNPLTCDMSDKHSLRQMLASLRDYAREVNEEWAYKLNINPAAAITTVKPSGTVSQLVGCGSGIHAWHSKYYLRTTRLDKKDPVYHFMQAKGVPIEDCVSSPATTAVATFPIQAPDGAKTRDSVTAMEMLELWLIYQRYWCEHKPSITISVKNDDWVNVGAWVFDHFDEISGISFMPHFDSDHAYQQAPYQELTEDEYLKWVADNPMPDIDWTELAAYENDDNTVSSQTLACSGGSCDIV